MRLKDILWVWWKTKHPSIKEKEMIEKMNVEPILFFLAKKKRALHRSYTAAYFGIER